MAIAIVAMFGSMAANAQVPPRFYWKTLQGMNAVPVIAMSVSGNVNPLDPSLNFDPSVSSSLSAEVAIAGYAKMFPVWNKAAMLAVLVPMGRIDRPGTPRRQPDPVRIRVHSATCPAGS